MFSDDLKSFAEGYTELNGMDRFRGDIGGVCLASKLGRECHFLMMFGNVVEA